MTRLDALSTSAERDSALEHLAPEECWRLVSGASTGRLAVALPHRSPLVVPVNYVVRNEAVLFRTDTGSKLDALRDHPVSFQVDLIDPIDRTGWSVLIRGFAHETSSADTDPDPWAPGRKDHWVRIQAIEITGRRIVQQDIPPHGLGYL